MRVHCVFDYFSPSGKLVQIEYALAAVAAGAPSVGIKGRFSMSRAPDKRGDEYNSKIIFLFCHRKNTL